MGSTPIHGSRQRDRRASATRRRLCEDTKVIFPLPDGGLLPRTFTVAGGVAVEALLNQRLEIGAEPLARVQPEAAKIGINVHAVEVKDVMFPADLKRAFADVLKAKQEGQAALQRARGESASLRNLANAARVLEGNPALMNLRLMQSLTAAQSAGNTLVLGLPGGFIPLKAGKTATSDEVRENGSAES